MSIPGRPAKDPQTPPHTIADLIEASSVDEDTAHFMTEWFTAANAEFLTATVPYERLAPGLLTDAQADGLTREQAEATVRLAWDTRVRLARDNAERDMVPALRGAFSALSASGLIVREDFGFDNDEGHDLMAEEEAAKPEHADSPGYVFFHRQDAERLIDGPGPLHLRFGALRYTSRTAAGKYAEDEAIGRMVVDALRAAGLAPDWDGTGASTIVLDDFAWYAMPGPQEA